MSTGPNVHLPAFTKLQTSITLALFEQQTEEPQYEALDSYTENSDRFSRLSEYASDIGRIFKEIKLAHSLILRLPSDDFFIEHESTKEDYVMYHYGHFLDLIHQMKDKLTRLVKGLTTPPPFKEPKKADTLSLAEKEEIKKIPELSTLLHQWTEAPDKKHNIAVMLRRRTQYHHFRNRLHLNKDFLDVKLFRVMQQEPAQKMLSEEGKKLIEERGTKGFEKWYSGVEIGIKSTSEDVRQNLEAISTALSSALPLPSMEKDGNKIFDDYFKMTESLKIKPVASMDHYNKTAFYPVVKTFESMLPAVFGEDIVSLYLVGSTTRGDATVGVSDINFILVTRDQAKLLPSIVHKLATHVSSKVGVYVNFGISTQTDFKKAQSALLRFICKTDGLLLTGVDLIGSEKFPKPGLGLACLFKERIKKEVETVSEELKKDTSLTQEQVSSLGKIIAKAGLRLMFGAVMADTARYERSWDGMQVAIIEKFPENLEMTTIFHGIATGSGTVDLDNLKNLVTGFTSDSSLGKLLTQLDEKCNN